MTWSAKTLRDGSTVPGIAYGSASTRSSAGVSKTADHISTAIRLGFRHLDTAQQYRNEDQVGEGIKRSGVRRQDIYITTKWSEGDRSPLESCRESLRLLQVDYIDLYVIHHTWTAKGDIPGAWKQMEQLLEMGLVKSIGLSAFGLDETKQVVESCSVKPALGMIMYHPNVLREMTPLVDYMKAHGIALGAYSPIKPLWEQTSPATVEVVTQLAAKTRTSPDQILLAWSKAKGWVSIPEQIAEQAKRSVVYTSSSDTTRMQGYLDAGDVVLSDEQIAFIDRAGLGL